MAWNRSHQGLRHDKAAHTYTCTKTILDLYPSPYLLLALGLWACWGRPCMLCASMCFGPCAMRCAPCAVRCAPCRMRRAPCTVRCAPCEMRCAPCTVRCAPCEMHCAPCTMRHAPHAMHGAPFAVQPDNHAATWPCSHAATRPCGHAAMQRRSFERGMSSQLSGHGPDAVADAVAGCCDCN
eukprot:365497-Chlamydomonas_euryale.AAC.4